MKKYMRTLGCDLKITVLFLVLGESACVFFDSSGLFFFSFKPYIPKLGSASVCRDEADCGWRASPKGTKST